MSSGVVKAVFQFNGTQVAVDFKIADFSSQVNSIKSESVSKALMECGVFATNIPDNDGVRIFVSKYLDDELQSLSALHEVICMNWDDFNCMQAEMAVVTFISDPDLRERYISMRVRLFKALVELDPSCKEFRDTLHALNALKA